LWVADHLALETTVVVKLVVSEMLEWQNDDPLERFQKNIEIVTELDSPHVVQVLGRGAMSDGTPYLVMERLEGENLEVRLARCGKMTPTELADVAVHVGRALTAAHQQGIAHCDIRPRNIFLVETSGALFCKVLDFARARRTCERVGEPKPNSLIMAAARYMSPERQDGRPIDHHVDLWALAVVLYRGLTGKLPFHEDNMARLWMRIFASDYVAPSKIETALDPAVDAWFKKAFALRPEKRFASATELAESFRGAVEGYAPAEPLTASAADSLPTMKSRQEPEKAPPASEPSATPWAFARSSTRQPTSAETSSTKGPDAALRARRKRRRLEAAVAAATVAAAVSGAGMHYAGDGSEANAVSRAARSGLAASLVGALSATAERSESAGEQGSNTAAPHSASETNAHGSSAKPNSAPDKTSLRVAAGSRDARRAHSARRSRRDISLTGPHPINWGF